jgi:hypothetical protein
MSDTQAKQQIAANLTALRRQLEEVAAKAKVDGRAVDRSKGIQGPVLVVRGK